MSQTESIKGKSILFERHFRTPYSEGYYIYSEEMSPQKRIGNIDIHFTMTTVHATLILEHTLSQEDSDHLLQYIDEELVLSADMPRDDFLVTVYIGKDTGFYSDDYFAQKAEVEQGEDTPSS